MKITKEKKLHHKDYLQDRYVSRDLDGVWCADYTRIDRINILIVLDLSTRQIVTYQTHIKKPKDKEFNKVNDSSWLIFAMNTVGSQRGLPKIFHSDRGGAFLSTSFLEYLEKSNIKSSITNSKYKKFSNQVIERFNRTLKDRLCNRITLEFKNPTKRPLNKLSGMSNKKILTWINEEIEDYNNSPHSHLLKASPNEIEDALLFKENNLKNSVKKINPKDIEIILPELARSNTKAAIEIASAKSLALQEYNEHWSNYTNLVLGYILKQFQLAEERHKETLSVLESNREAIVKEIKQESAKVIENQETLISDLRRQVSEQGQQLEYLAALAAKEEQAKKKAEERRESRKNRVRRLTRDGATLPEFYSCIDAINQSTSYRSEYARSRDKVSILILYLTGIRSTNLLYCTVSTLNSLLYENEFRVPVIKKKKSVDYVWPLSHISNKLALEFESDIKTLQKDKEPGDPVFTAFGSLKPIDRACLDRRLNLIIKPAAKSSSGKNCTTHSFRIGHVTSAISVLGLADASKAIGHEDIETTLLYRRNELIGKDKQDKVLAIDELKQKRISRYKEKSVNENNKSIF